MKSFADVTILGHVTIDPVGKITNSWNNITSFWVAVNRKQKSWDEYKEVVNYFDVKIWWVLGENALKLVKKWSYVLIKWSLIISQWNDDLWNKKSRPEVIANEFYLLDKKPSENKSKDTLEQEQILENEILLDLSDISE